MKSPQIHHDSDKDRGPMLLAMWWTELSICIIVVAMRMYSRYTIKNIGNDDWFIVVALVLFITSTVLVTVSACHGWGRHLYYLEPKDVKYILELSLFEIPLDVMASATAKISVASLLLRLAGPVMPWRKRLLYWTIFLTLIFGTLTSILIFVQCDPPRTLWESLSKSPGIATNKCWSKKVGRDFSKFNGGFYAFVDVLLAFIAVALIWQLNLKFARKILIGSLLSLGVIAGICSAVRAYFLRVLDDPSDFTWASYNLLAWTSAELFTIIVCACIPTLKPIYDLANGSLRSVTSHFFTKVSRMRRQRYHNFDTSDGKSPESQPDIFGRANIERIIDTDRIDDTSYEISHPAYGGSDSCGNDDKDISIKLGSIHVERGWEVHRAEMQRSSNEIAPHQLSEIEISNATELSSYEAV